MSAFSSSQKRCHCEECNDEAIPLEYLDTYGIATGRTVWYIPRDDR